MDTDKPVLEQNTPNFGWSPSSDKNSENKDATAVPYNVHPPPKNVDSIQPMWFPGSGNSSNYWQNHFPSPFAPSAGSGLSRESSRDDLTSVELEQVFDFEERFRVDRRKLELLILGRFEPLENETAVDYFHKIGEDTNTTVIWPSRLKIGAKSKKDPHIRIGGQEEGVLAAKHIIMEHLDVKTRRVTMKMDVSYTDHSHIIGKGGNTIRRVMSETGCHIHFPDSNRSNPTEKSNQVSIAGRELEGVEKARARVRELTPLIFYFDLPIMTSLQDSAVDTNDPFLKTVQDQYNVQLNFRVKQKNFHTTMAVVKGCEWEASRVKEATLILIDHLCGSAASSTPTTPTSVASAGGLGQHHQLIPVTMNMEISPIHHGVVVGKQNLNLKVIMQRTKTTILFPDSNDPNIPPIRKGSVSISGNIHNVYSARQQLIGALPLVLMFDMPDGQEIDEPDIHKISEDLEVTVSIKPKIRQDAKSVLIKSQERHASAMYEARHRLLKIDDDEEDLVKAEVPEAYKIQPITAQTLSNIGMSPSTTSYPSPLDAFAAMGNEAASSLLFPNVSPGLIQLGSNPAAAGISATPFAPPYLLPSHTPWAGAALNTQQFGNVLPPNHPYLQDYAVLVLNSITRMQQQQQLFEQQQQLLNRQQQQQQQQQLQQQQQPLPYRGFERNNNDWITEANNNHLKVNDQPAGDTIHSPPVRGASPRNSSPIQDTGNLTNNLSKLDLNGTRDDKFTLHSSTISEEAAGHDQSSSSGLGTSGTSGSCAMDPDLNSTFGHLFPDRRAPGCELKNLQCYQKTLDYDQQKLLATRAIQSKPSAGEPRTPTPSWSGLGFSNSMPEHIIKEKMVAEQTILPAEVTGEGGDNIKNNVFSANHGTSNAWFGNSSAFDALLNGPKMGTTGNGNVGTAGSILPTAVDNDDLPSVFAKEGLAKYTDLFVRHEVDLQTFATLTEQDLREIGIQTFGARKKLLLLANKVKQSLNNKPW